MKTKLLSLMLFALLLATAACGGGESEAPKETSKEYTANDITITLPSTWAADYGQNEKQILISAPKEEYVLGIQILETGPATAEEFAALMSKELKGTQPEAAPAYGNYAFDASIMGFPAHTTILTVEGFSLVLVEIGDYKKFAEAAKGILKSMKSTNPSFQKVIGAIKF